ncbi:uncharacterized protein LOC135688334 isoform X1 [Rhopilema esculentum]|uniref:uncharacterized protein LOC135688334 isoform X1 n=1 Tax=Rhopilema esculentum TaxID=499914 RepID=UPI0031D6D14C
MNFFIISSVLLATFYLASGAPAPGKSVAVKVPEIKPIGSSSEDPQQKPGDVQPQTKPDSEDGLGGEEIKEDEEKTESNVFKGPETTEEEEEEEIAELNPDLFEGDLKLTKSEIDKIKDNTISKKDTIAFAEKKWPNARVPFVIDAKFGKYQFRSIIYYCFSYKSCFFPSKVQSHIAMKTEVYC